MLIQKESDHVSDLSTSILIVFGSLRIVKILAFDSFPKCKSQRGVYHVGYAWPLESAHRRCLCGVYKDSGKGYRGSH